MKAYIVEVRKTAKGPQIVVSRTHPGLVRRLFELEVPELVDGVVEIRAVAREPGHRTKLAVASNDQNVDPVGACVGARGMRVRQVVNELRGEKVDIVPFSSDGPEFVMRALAPAKVREVRLHEDTGIAEVIVPDFQLSLAIGKEGQNARLAARLTGWRVDIKSESQLAEEESGGGYAEGEWVEGPDGGLMWQPAEGGEAISAAEAGYATLGEGAPTDGATAEGAPAEGTTSDGSPDSPDAGEQIAVAPEETAMHVEASVADEAADEIAADADLGTAEADIRAEANQEIEETATPETVEES
jgi:N utilization substance protein A